MSDNEKKCLEKRGMVVFPMLVAGIWFEECIETGKMVRMKGKRKVKTRYGVVKYGNES